MMSSLSLTSHFHKSMYAVSQTWLSWTQSDCETLNFHTCAIHDNVGQTNYRGILFGPKYEASTNRMVLTFYSVLRSTLSYSGLKTTLTRGILRFNSLNIQGRQLVITLSLLDLNCLLSKLFPASLKTQALYLLELMSFVVAAINGGILTQVCIYMLISVTNPNIYQRFVTIVLLGCS